MIVDCAIIGGGPAGLNAALVLARARRTVMVFDDNQPRNAVAQKSHGFLTRDGITPVEFRNIAHQEISKYPSVETRQLRITDVRNQEDSFELVANNGEVFRARTIILATGLKQILPDIDGIHDFFGKSLFDCPYCDGWELKDRPLVVISAGQNIFHLAATAWNWSRDVLVCTNGQKVLTRAQKEALLRKEVQVVEDPITALVGESGMLERVVFATHEESRRSGGFVSPQWIQASSFGISLGCELNELGGILADSFGRTMVKGVYAAGEVTVHSQLIIAAAQGSMAAMGVNMDLIESEFLEQSRETVSVSEKS